MKLFSRISFRILKRITFGSLLAFIILYLLLIYDQHSSDVESLKKIIKNTSDLTNKYYERKDWHDWDFIDYEKKRKGPGEHGKPFVLTDPADIELNEKLRKEDGMHVIVSDKISVNRSIPDFRFPK